MPSIGIEEIGVGDRIAQAVRAQLQKYELTRQRTVSVVTGGERGQRQNALIARVQARLGRDPWFLTREQSERMRFIANGLTSSDPSTRDRAWADMGWSLMAAVKENLARAVSRGLRPFTANTPSYQAWKRKHFPGRPQLVATGDLSENLSLRFDT